jgi:hypothetical protein
MEWYTRFVDDHPVITFVGVFLFFIVLDLVRLALELKGDARTGALLLAALIGSLGVLILIVASGRREGAP